MSKLLKAFSWDFMGSVFGYGSSFITSLFLARLLSPEEFGIVAIAMVFILYFGFISEFGFKHALIQSQDTNQKGFSSVFFVNLGVGLFLAALTILIAPFVADFYNKPLLVPIIRLLAIVFVFNSLTTVQVAILSKELDFRSLSIRLIIAKLISSICGIILAFKGYGAFALVWQEVIFSVLNAFLLWILSPWKPSWVFSLKEIKSLIQFGGYIFYGQILHQSINRLDELLIGKLFSPAVLGYYGRSDSISQIINGVSTKSINNFFFPFFSRMQTQKERFNRWYFSIYRLVCYGSFLMAGIAIILSENIIIGLFGDQWYASVDIFEILMFKLITFPASTFLVATLLSQGFSRENFYYGLLKKALRALPIIIGVFLGFNAFLYSLVVVSFISMIYGNYINSRFLNVSMKDQLMPFVLPGLLVGCLIYIVKVCVPADFSGSLYMFAVAFVFFLVYAAFFFAPVISIIKSLKNDS